MNNIVKETIYRFTDGEYTVRTVHGSLAWSPSQWLAVERGQSPTDLRMLVILELNNGSSIYIHIDKTCSHFIPQLTPEHTLFMIKCSENIISLGDS